MADIETKRPANLDAVLQHLSEDGLVAFPTETVWGLAARACSPAAVEGLMSFKGRASDQPVSVLIDGAETLESLGVARTPVLNALVEAFWPGPLTVVAAGPSEGFFAPGICGATGAVGFRCSDHPLTSLLARESIRRELGPLTATSLNRSGETAVENYSEAILIAKSSADHELLVLDAQHADASALPPSTVIDVSGDSPRILREGATSGDSIEAVLDRFRDASQRR